jgi:hypothetical protein
LRVPLERTARVRHHGVVAFRRANADRNFASGLKQRDARMARRGYPFTLGHLLVAAAASALTYVALRWPDYLLAVVAVVVVPLAIAGLLRVLVGAMTSHQCPACGAWGLRRYAVTPFGYRYFRCSECGAKCKRGIAGAWFDASGRADQAVYSRKAEKDPWGDGPVAPAEDSASGTHALLLRNKRERQPPADGPNEV